MKHHEPHCQGGPKCNCDDLDMDTLKIGSFILYFTERLMVDQIDSDKEVVWASCAMGKEFEIPFGGFDIIR